MTDGFWRCPVSRAKQSGGWCTPTGLTRVTTRAGGRFASGLPALLKKTLAHRRCLNHQPSTLIGLRVTPKSGSESLISSPRSDQERYDAHPPTPHPARRDSLDAQRGDASRDRLGVDRE